MTNGREYAAVFPEIANILNTHPGVKATVDNDPMSGSSIEVTFGGGRYAVLGDAWENWGINISNNEEELGDGKFEVIELNIPVEDHNAAKIAEAFLTAVGIK